MRFLLLALCLAGCLSPPSGLVITGATPAEVEQIHGVLSAAITVTGDVRGALRGDLGVRVAATRGEVAEYCLPDDSRTAGCNYPSGNGFVIVVDGEGMIPFLAHEAWHVATGSYNEVEAAAGAIRIEEAYRLQSVP